MHVEYSVRGQEVPGMPIYKQTISWILVCIFLALFPGMASAQAPSLAEAAARVRASNQSLFAFEPRTQAAAIRQELTRRRQLLLDIMVRSPKQAGALMFSPEQAQRFRSLPGVTPDLVEVPDTVRGVAEVRVADSPDFTSSVTIFTIGSGADKVTAYQEGTVSLQAKCNDTLRISGLRLGSAMLVNEAAVDQVAPLTSCSPLGAQSVAVLLVKMPSDATPTVTAQDMQAAFLGNSGTSISNYFAEGSYNQVSFTGNVVGWLTLDRAYTCNEADAIREAAINAADSLVDFRNYSRVQIVFPAISGCSFGGLGTVGCESLSSAGDGTFTASVSWVNLYSFDIPALTTYERIGDHEMGHNFGLNHSHSLKYHDQFLGPDRTQPEETEYGDPFSVMGSSNGHYSAPQKVALGWLHAADFQAVTASGTYVIAPLESAAAGVRALKVQRNLLTNEFLWIEYRQNTGLFDSQFTASQSSVFSGALIHFEDPSTGTASELLDSTVSTSTFNDAALANGSTFIDPYSNLRIQVTAATAAGLTVVVAYDTPCATFTAPSTTSFSNTAQQVTVNVTAPSNCSWNATGNNFWIASPATTQSGNGTVNVSLSQNPGLLGRPGSFSIARQTTFIRQFGTPQAPSIVYVNPNQGSLPSGYVAMDVYVRDLNGSDDLSALHIQFGTSQTSVSTCYIKYDFINKQLALMNDGGTDFQADKITLGDWRSIENSQCYAGYMQVDSPLQTEMRFNFYVAFKSNTPNTRNVYSMLEDRTGLTTNWSSFGTLTLGATCAQGVRPGEQLVGPGSGTFSISLQDNTGCSWNASSDSAWLRSLTASGTSAASILIQYDAFNGQGSRTGIITFGTSQLTVIQSATNPVSATLTPVESTFLAAGGTGSVSVDVTPSTLNWTVTNNNSDWITVTSSTSLTGTQTVSYSVAANTGVARQGSLTVAAGAIFTISQGGTLPLPAITAINPTFGLPGTVVAATLTGTDLGGATAVVLSGTGVTATVGNGTATSLPVSITLAADAAVGQRTLTVTTAGGTSPAFAGFSVLSMVISALDANPSGLSQASAPLYGGPFTLTINGVGFQSGAVASLGSTNLTTSFVNSTQLTTQVTTAALAGVGPQNVKVTNPSGPASNVVPLNVIERGDLNGNRSVNIGDALVCALTVGGLTRPALASSVGDVNLNGSTSIGDCLVVALFAGRANANFSIPDVTSVSPLPMVRSNTVTINGSGFSSNASDNQVLFTRTGGVVSRVTPTTAATTSLTVSVPSDAIGGPLQVYRVNAPIGGTVYPATVSGTATPLLLTSVAPYFQVATGASVTLAGLGFDSTPANNVVTFKTSSGGTTTGSVTAATATSLTVTVPSDAACGGVTVTASAQTSNARMIVVSGTTCPLILTDIFGSGGPGDTLVIEGAGFDVVRPSNNTVTFATASGTVSATVVAAGGTQLHVRIPDTAIQGNLTVTRGTTTSNALTYRGP